MKVALMADSLLGQGGAEKTFAVMCRAFPESDVYTTVYEPELAPTDLRQCRIHELVRGQRFRTYDGLRRNFLAAIAQLQRFTFSDYDVVLSSVGHLARFLRKGSAKHISYTYYPFRLLYEPHLYPQIRGAKRAAFYLLRSPLRAWDRAKARQVDQFVSISRLSRAAIKRHYGADSTVLHSPILNLPQRLEPVVRQEYYLLVSRLEPWKQLDVVVRAFAAINARLVVVGNGPERPKLQSMATPNVNFVGSISESELADHYRRCLALIHPTPTEYGLTPIEANAHGTAAICLGTAGVLDTMVPYHADAVNATAVFYSESSPEALRRAVRAFHDTRINPEACFRNAQRFGAAPFIRRLRELVYGEQRAAATTAF